MEAKILSRRFVKPSAPTPDHLRIHKLSIFDQLAPPKHVPLVFFYNNFPMEGKFEQLVRSLSETLTRFYPLAGRFVEDGFYIDCNDEGVLYLEAEKDAHLSDFLNVAMKNIHLVNDLLPWADIGETTLVTTPIVGIKVTMFKCGGVSIGTLVSHLISDGFTGNKFIGDWSSTTSSHLLGSINHAEDPSLKLANFDVPSYFPCGEISMDMIKNVAIPSSKLKLQSELVTKRFVFDEKSLTTLKAKVSDYASVISKPTRVEVVASTIWKALINLSKPRDSTIYLHLNLRGRTDGISGMSSFASSCGNFYLEVPTRFKHDEKNVELHNLVGLLRSSLRNSITKCSKISSSGGLLMEVAKNVNEIREDKGNEEVDVWLLTSLCRFPFYEFDFGWGKPEWVTTGGLPVEVIFLFDTKCGTGIEAIISLHQTDMLHFEDDPDIIAFTS